MAGSSGIIGGNPGAGDGSPSTSWPAASASPNNLGQGKYGDGSDSSIGSQFRTDWFHKKALTEMVKEQYFTPMASVRAMPKHYGKTIKQYHYMPLLDERNTNTQGIGPDGSLTPATTGGHLYGSSKDVGTIVSKVPVLSEFGGRVNRVGFKRIDLQATIQKLGFFYEITQESLDFDSDAELDMHLAREAINGAGEITEDMLQVDLLNSAGLLRYGGTATSRLTVTGEGAAISIMSYDALQRMSIDLDNNRTPKKTKIITGTRLIDTKVIDAARPLFVGTEMVPTLKKMTDHFNNQAFIPIQHYASSSKMRGEIGTIDQFRIIVVPEMQHWAAGGAAKADANTKYRWSDNGGEKYDVFPLLSVGNESFTTIGFQTDGKTVKFKITTKKPGEAMATHQDPYGETGFSSIKWYYGTMILRPERIALAHSVAEL
jgi:N4-gp56 family major capsid protein